MGGNMNKKVLFVLFAILMMAVMTASVSADQLANDRWCNSDQYGCWVTGDDGAQDYIMFWSESAREYFMGPGSNAVVTDPVPAGKMSLDPAPKTLVDILRDMISDRYKAAGMDDWIEMDAKAMAYDIEHGNATFDDIQAFLDKYY